MDERRLGDFVKQVSPDGTRLHLVDLANAIRRGAQWVTDHRERDERTAAAINLLTSLARYVETHASNLGGELEVLALCARSAFELNLRVRMVLESSDGLKRWIAEAADERIETMEGFIGVARSSGLDGKPYEEEKQRLINLKEKHSLPAEAKGRMQERQLADKFGLAKDYDALYKLLSKIVHPSSFLVNGRALIDTDDTRNILLMTLQIKALDSLTRIADDLGIPASVTSPASQPN